MMMLQLMVVDDGRWWKMIGRFWVKKTERWSEVKWSYVKGKWGTTLEYQTVAYNSQDDRMLAPQNHRIKQPYASGVCDSRRMPTAIKPTTTTTLTFTTTTITLTRIETRKLLSECSLWLKVWSLQKCLWKWWSDWVRATKGDHFK